MTARPRIESRASASRALGRAVGVASIGSAAAALAWVVGLAPGAGFPDRWISVWNLLLVPAAVWLGVVLGRARAGGTSGTRNRTAAIAAISAAAGVLACLTWAIFWNEATLEPAWIGLSAVWWLGTGWLLLQRGIRGLGWLTIVLGAFAAIDSAMTAAGIDGVAYLLAGPKLPLGWIWALAIGIRLVVDPGLEPDSR